MMMLVINHMGKSVENNSATLKLIYLSPKAEQIQNSLDPPMDKTAAALDPNVSTEFPELIDGFLDNDNDDSLNGLIKSYNQALQVMNTLPTLASQKTCWPIGKM
jgi:hypothetical protein